MLCRLCLAALANADQLRVAQAVVSGALSHHPSSLWPVYALPQVPLGYAEVVAVKVPHSAMAAGRAPDDDTGEPVADLEEPYTRRVPKIPLHLVIAGCPSLKTFYQGDIRHWHQLFDAACHVRPAMGISVSAWEEAQRCMGPEQASIVVVAMLERFSDIRSPGGYLRALTSKAAAGEFSCGPMVMALIGRRSAA